MRASSTYLTAIFDAMASGFDAKMEGDRIAYDVPRVLHSLLIRLNVHPRDGEGPRWGRVLDLGCGTGLNGPLYAKESSSIIGVDISPRMVEQVRARAIGPSHPPILPSSHHPTIPDHPTIPPPHHLACTDAARAGARSWRVLECG